VCVFYQIWCVSLRIKIYNNKLLCVYLCVYMAKSCYCVTYIHIYMYIYVCVYHCIIERAIKDHRGNRSISLHML
jgi:hypothetical protein